MTRDPKDNGENKFWGKPITPRTPEEEKILNKTLREIADSLAVRSDNAFKNHDPNHNGE